MFLNNGHIANLDIKHSNYDIFYCVLFQNLQAFLNPNRFLFCTYLNGKVKLLHVKVCKAKSQKALRLMILWIVEQCFSLGGLQSGFGPSKVF